MSSNTFATNGNNNGSTSFGSVETQALLRGFSALVAEEKTSKKSSVVSVEGPTSGGAFLEALQGEAKQHQDKKMKGSTLNGDVNWASMGYGMKAAFVEWDNKAVRDVDRARFASLQDTVMSRIDGIASVKDRAYAWTLYFRYLFYLRKIRGQGKGEKALFHQAFTHSFAKFPQTSLDLLPLVWEYGYGGDLMALLVQSVGKKTSALVSGTLNEYARKLNLDLTLVFGDMGLAQVQVPDLKAKISELRSMSSEERIAFAKALPGTLSLAGKWLSSEGHSKDKKVGVAKLMVQFFFYQGVDLTSMFTSSDKSIRSLGLKKMNYGLNKLRLIKTLLNILLDTPQVKMCDGRWSQLRIEALSSLTMFKFSKAFLNEKKDVALSEADAETGNRHPDDLDRVECRKNTIAATVKGALKGATLQITALADKIVSCFKQANSLSCRFTYQSVSGWRGHQTLWSVDPVKLTTSQRQIFVVQWQKAMEEVKRIIDEAKAEALAKAETPEEIEAVTQQLEAFQNALMVVDVSGSMFGANVGAKAVGLGLMGAELSKVHDVVLTFTENPIVLDFRDCGDIVDRFLKVMCSPWGYTTDADKVGQLVIKVAQDAAKRAGASSISGFLPGAVVMLTDGQFNGGNGMCPNLTDKTLLQRYEEYLATHAPGVPMWRSVFWNLNDSPGFQALVGAENVQLVSGYDQSLFKQLLVGDYEMVVDPTTGVVKAKVDPWTTFMKAMEDPELVLVMEVLSRSTEGVMAHYTLAGLDSA